MEGFSLSKNLETIFASKTAIFAMIALVIFIFLFIKIRQIKFTPKIISMVGLAVALSTVLSMLKLYKMPQGGSITLGSMVPIILMAIFYGPEVGFLTGFLVGVMGLFIDPYILHPIQVLFDYPLPFMALGLAGYFKNNKYVGTVVGILGRYIFHILSGVIFFASYAGNQNPLIYSIIYNISYLGPDAIVCFVIMSLLPIKELAKRAA
jgi:thiamine transporter